MKAAILIIGALVAGCATTPERAIQGDTIPLNAAPVPGDLKVEHYRFKDDVIPGAVVDRSGYTPTIVIGDPAGQSTLKGASATVAGDYRQPTSEQVIQSATLPGPVEKVEQGDKLNAAASQICATTKNDCVLAELFFDLNQSELSPLSTATIDRIDASGKSLELIGYADAIGEKDYNGKLAVARAAAVRKALMAAGAKEVVVRAGHEARFSGPKFRKVIIVGL